MTTLSALTGFDWFLLALVLLSTLGAFRRGIVKVAFSLAGLVAGILVASWNYTALAARLSAYVASHEVANIVAFVILLVVVMALFSLAARLVRKTISAVGFGFLDRLLGAMFGLVRGLLLGVAAMMLVAAFVPQAEWLKNSLLAPYFLSGAHAVSFVVPEHFRQQIGSGATFLLQQTPVLFRPHTY